MASPLPLASSLLRATADTLRRQAPFADMTEADLAWTAERLSVAYFPQDAALIEADGKPPAYLFVVKQGVVEGEAPDGKGGRLLQLTDGEMFPLGALLAGRAVANRYVAAADTFCYRLPAADFHGLRQDAPQPRFDEGVALLDDEHRVHGGREGADFQRRERICADMQAGGPER